MTAGRRAAPVGLGAAASLVALAAYQIVLRPWHLAFGATAAERRALLPGDDLLPAPTLVSTRAITIHAPATAVWPWLVQLGKDRGGLYSYTVLENLFGLGIHNADEILPEHQHLEFGQRVSLGAGFAILAREIDPPRSLVWEFSGGGWIWTFHCADAPDGATRLIVRNRWTSLTGGPLRKLAGVVLEPSAFVMEQRMLRGIRDRAQRAR